MSISISPAIREYLDTREKSRRIKVLNGIKQAHEHLPISLCEDLLVLDLSVEEKLALLDATGSNDDLVYEHYLTQHLNAWSQDLAGRALRLWVDNTDHLLWFRLLHLGGSTHVSQRVRYIILENAKYAGGRLLLTTIANMDGLKELSPAFHGLLLHRCVQWGVANNSLSTITFDALKSLKDRLHPENKAIPTALAYAARFESERLREFADKHSISESWRDLIRGVAASMKTFDAQHDQLLKLVKKPPKSRRFEKLNLLWPPVWSRNKLSKDVIATSLKWFLNEDLGRLTMSEVSEPWEFFAGIEAIDFRECLPELDDNDLPKALKLLAGLLPVPTDQKVLALVKERLTKAEDPAKMLGALPLALRLELTQAHTQSPDTNFAKIKKEESKVINGEGEIEFNEFRDAGHQDESEDDAFYVARKEFFNLAYRNRSGETSQGHSFFHLLIDSWKNPDEAKLAELAQAARQEEGIFRLCYLNTLGRFNGHDQAALKLLDYIRSKEEDDLRAVVFALSGIGTPRALQELVAAITRPNITAGLQMTICYLLEKQNMKTLQKEIRAAINDLAVNPRVDDGTWELKEALSNLLIPLKNPDENRGTFDVDTHALNVIASDQDLDKVLMGKIRHYKDLSSEVKRALRTSQFFDMQVSTSHAPGSIDLSPVIDMQYKALELFFRETYEDPCSRLIHKGILQRKLDVLGYARPVPRAMDEFENQIGNLPTIRDIPFFSKFKLRKMLRAICTFRPGKRFTLDGLKAFALFFLCFSRQQCRHGLNGLFPLGFESDQQLFEFSKALHVLQDARNRAAHEGFHPDAANDIDGIWQATAEIVQTVFKTLPSIEADIEAEYAPRNVSNPIIEKKVS